MEQRKNTEKGKEYLISDEKRINIGSRAIIPHHMLETGNDQVGTVIGMYPNHILFKIKSKSKGSYRISLSYFEAKSLHWLSDENMKRNGFYKNVFAAIESSKKNNEGGKE